MTRRPLLRSVGAGTPPNPPSVLFQQLSADYPDLPRRVVGEVLSRVYGAAWDSSPRADCLPRLDRAARALLDAMRVRAEDAVRRTGRNSGLCVVGPHARESRDRSDATGLGERLPILDDRAEIHQATGMVSVQLGVNVGTALDRIRARAFAEGRLLSDLACAVVARTVRFKPEDYDRMAYQHDEAT